MSSPTPPTTPHPAPTPAKPPVRNVLLNNVEHRDLAIRTRRGAAYGDAVMAAPTFPDEFRSVQAHYPIVFQATTSGSFQPLALFGFKDGENLFLGKDGWDADYLPVAVERLPFLIGRDGDELVVHVDLASPRVTRRAPDAEPPPDDPDPAVPVFLPQGGTSPYLERVNRLLLTLHQGLQATPAFIDALRAHQLLESFVVDVTAADGSQHRLAGFHTIHEERLAALDAGALDALHRAGHLLPTYMALASLANFRALIGRRHRAHAADA
jgi:hypothetical protein